MTSVSSASGGAFVPPQQPAHDGAKRLGLIARLRRAFGREDGTASMEFVLVVPMLLMIFMASFESGLLVVRHVLLDQSVDLTMRELRLGHLVNPTHDLIKREICKRSIILKDCESRIRVELSPVSTVAWNFPTQQQACVDRTAEVDPPQVFNPGAPHQVMLVRVCVAQDAMFPSTGVGLGLKKDGDRYWLIASSAFVNEP